MVQQFRESVGLERPSPVSIQSTTSKNTSNGTLLQPIERIYNKFPAQTTTTNKYLTNEAKLKINNQCKDCGYIFCTQHNKQEKIRRERQRNLFDKLAETLRITEDVTVYFLSTLSWSLLKLSIFVIPFVKAPPQLN